MSLTLAPSPSLTDNLADLAHSIAAAIHQFELDALAKLHTQLESPDAKLAQSAARLILGFFRTLRSKAKSPGSAATDRPANPPANIRAAKSTLALTATPAQVTTRSQSDAPSQSATTTQANPLTYSLAQCPTPEPLSTEFVSQLHISASPAYPALPASLTTQPSPTTRTTRIIPTPAPTPASRLMLAATACIPAAPI